MFSPDSTLLAFGEPSKSVQLIQTSTGDELATLEPPVDKNKCWTCCFSRDGTRLAVSTDNHTIHLWDLARIREQLATMGLDWPLPPLPPAAPLKERSGPCESVWMRATWRGRTASRGRICRRARNPTKVWPLLSSRAAGVQLIS